MLENHCPSLMIGIWSREEEVQLEWQSLLAASFLKPTLHKNDHNSNRSIRRQVSKITKRKGIKGCLWALTKRGKTLKAERAVIERHLISHQVYLCNVSDFLLLFHSHSHWPCPLTNEQFLTGTVLQSLAHPLHPSHWMCSCWFTSHPLPQQISEGLGLWDCLGLCSCSDTYLSLRPWANN